MRATARAVPIDTRVCCVLCRVAAVSVKPRQNAIDTRVLCRVAAVSVKPRQNAINTCVLCRVAAVKPRQKA